MTVTVRIKENITVFIYSNANRNVQSIAASHDQASDLLYFVFVSNIPLLIYKVAKFNSSLFV